MESLPSGTPPVEIETAPAPSASVIWLHGLGADGHDFEPVVPELSLPLPVRFVFPHAPLRAVTINAGFIMRAWYDIAPAQGGFVENEDHIRESDKILQVHVRRELARGIPARRIVLAGFSQGGAIALHTGLRYGQRLAGILALSAYLPLSDRLAQESHAVNNEVPIFMAHGELDPLIPLPWAQQSRERLEGQGYKVDWHIYPIAHTVGLDEIRDVASWLSDVFAQPHPAAT